MTKELSVRDRVRSLIADNLNVPEDEVKDDAALVDDLGADSLDVVELVMAVEEAFGVTIDEPAAGTMHTVEDVWRLIEREVGRG